VRIIFSHKRTRKNTTERSNIGQRKIHALKKSCLSCHPVHPVLPVILSQKSNPLILHPFVFLLCSFVAKKILRIANRLMRANGFPRRCAAIFVKAGSQKILA
jgi:hypothetical protein